MPAKPPPATTMSCIADLTFACSCPTRNQRRSPVNGLCSASRWRLAIEHAQIVRLLDVRRISGGYCREDVQRICFDRLMGSGSMEHRLTVAGLLKRWSGLEVDRERHRPDGDCQNFCVRGVFSLAPDWASHCIEGMAYLANRYTWLTHVPWFDQSACSCVPTWHSVGIARRRGHIRRLRRDRSHAQPPPGGEHGEDPQFDRAEHDAMLRPREALF